MFKEGYKYFENHLGSYDERCLYQCIYQAIKDYQIYVTFDYPSITPSRAIEIMEYVFEDNPSFFYLDFQHCYAVYGKPSSLTFRYIYNQQEIQKYEDHIKHILMDFFDQYRVLRLSEYNRILIFHNFISSLCTYDPVVSGGGKGIEEDYNIIGVFKGKLAVCYGFSQVFKLLCDYGNIPCLIVKGHCYEGGYHAWNMVEYKGRFYHIDVTWDLSRDKNTRLLGSYNYFMVDDEWIKKTRTIEAAGRYPLSQGLEYTYFGYKHYMIQSHYELSDYIYRRLLEYSKEFIVYIADHHIDKEEINMAYNQALQRFRATVNSSFDRGALFYIDYKYSLVRYEINER